MDSTARATSLLTSLVKAGRARQDEVRSVPVVRLQMDDTVLRKQLSLNQHVDPTVLLPLLSGSEKSKKEAGPGPCSAVLTGSFLLWVLEGCPRSWTPGDVDVFTDSPHDVWRFRQALGTESHVETGEIYYEHAKTVVNNEKKPGYIERRREMARYYTPHCPYLCKSEYLADNDIVSVHTWEEEEGSEVPFKIQVIRVTSSVETHILRNFDIPAVRVWYDGKTLSTPVINLSTRSFTIDQVKFDTALQFERLLKRCHKYSARGYNLTLPAEIRPPPKESCEAIFFHHLIYREKRENGYYGCTLPAALLIPASLNPVSKSDPRFLTPEPWFLKSSCFQLKETEEEAGAGVHEAVDVGKTDNKEC